MGKIIPHATLEDVSGQEVVGVLPYNLAARADRVTVVELDPPPRRGEDLSAEEVAARVRRIESYVVIDEARQEGIINTMHERYPGLFLHEVEGAFATHFNKPSVGVVGVGLSEEMITLVKDQLERVNAATRMYEGVVGEEEVRGHAVVGSIPFGLAAAASRVVIPEFNLTEEERGKRLSADELGTRVRWCDYTVFPVEDFEHRMRLLESELNIHHSVRIARAQINENVSENLEGRSRVTTHESSLEL